MLARGRQDGPWGAATGEEPVRGNARRGSALSVAVERAVRARDALSVDRYGVREIGGSAGSTDAARKNDMLPGSRSVWVEGLMVKQ